MPFSSDLDGAVELGHLLAAEERAKCQPVWCPGTAAVSAVVPLGGRLSPPITSLPALALPGDSCLSGIGPGFTWQRLGKTPSGFGTRLCRQGGPLRPRALFIKLGSSGAALSATAQLRAWELEGRVPLAGPLSNHVALGRWLRLSTFLLPSLKERKGRISR